MIDAALADFMLVLAFVTGMLIGYVIGAPRRAEDRRRDPRHGH